MKGGTARESYPDTKKNKKKTRISRHIVNRSRDSQKVVLAYAGGAQDHIWLEWGWLVAFISICALAARCGTKKILCSFV